MADIESQEIDVQGNDLDMTKCSKSCIHWKRHYRPWYGEYCSRGEYSNKTEEGKQCKYFKIRMSEMFKMKSKEDILKKYIELLKIENKNDEEKAQIKLLDWIFNKEGE